MLSYWIYILVGDNNRGKTAFQKHLIQHLCDKTYKSLPSNETHHITHSLVDKRMTTIFAMGRSFQETDLQNKGVPHFFQDVMEWEDICILSSHSNEMEKCKKTIQEMITEGRKLRYNIGGVFFDPIDNEPSKEIALFDWDERFHIHNEEESKWEEAISYSAKAFANMIALRSHWQ